VYARIGLLINVSFAAVYKLPLSEMMCSAQITYKELSYDL